MTELTNNKNTGSSRHPEQREGSPELSVEPVSGDPSLQAPRDEAQVTAHSIKNLATLNPADITVPAPYRSPTGYFRSKLFSSNAASNPLVAAASPLLSLVERLCVSQTLPAIEHIRDNIEHELFAFHSRLISQHYTDDTVALGHYLLSATIDELLGKNYVRLYGQHSEFKAFTPSCTNDVGPETQFFNILTHLKERAHQYLDLLELSYYCLIAGFEGEHHVRAGGRQVLDNLIEEIHKTIQQHRVHKPQLLFKTPTTTPINTELKNHKPFITIITISVLTLMIAYMGSRQLLNHQAKNLVQHYAIQTHADLQ